MQETTKRLTLLHAGRRGVYKKTRVGLIATLGLAAGIGVSTTQLRWPSIKSVCPGAVDLGLVPRQVKPMTLKLVFGAFLFDAQH